MAFNEPFMGLTCWNQLDDLYDHNALQTNFISIGQHDHAAGKGVQIGTGGIANGAVTTAKIAAQAVTLAQMALGAGRPHVVISAGGVNPMVSGSIYGYTGNSTATFVLPPPSADALVGVINVFGGTVTVTANGGGIIGAGINAGSLTLGSAGSRVLLQTDSTNWLIVDGQQDTGWVALELATGVNTNITVGGVGTFATASVRVQGDTGRLKGAMQNSSGTPISGTIATIPAGMRPVNPTEWAVTTPAGTGPNFVQILTTGVIGANTNSLAAGSLIDIDGITFPVI